MPETEKEGKAWSFEVMVWEATTGNVRSVYSVAQEILESAKQPDGLMLYSLLCMDPAQSGKVVIMHHGISSQILRKKELAGNIAQ